VRTLVLLTVRRDLRPLDHNQLVGTTHTHATQAEHTEISLAPRRPPWLNSIQLEFRTRVYPNVSISRGGGTQVPASCRNYITCPTFELLLPNPRVTPELYSGEHGLTEASLCVVFLPGGKRVRPMLCFAATEMFGGSVEVRIKDVYIYIYMYIYIYIYIYIYMCVCVCVCVYVCVCICM